MAKAKKVEVGVPEVGLKLEQVTLFLLGTTPFINHCLPEKARKELLYPSTKTKASRSQKLKHDVLAEYRDSCYVTDDSGAPTRIVIPAVSFKRVIESMCLDVPGLTKAGISRNVVAMGNRISIWGVPQLKMDTVRSADMARTPDIRTRAVLPEWACEVSIRFPVPAFNRKTIVDLLCIGGQLRGVGDYRPEKGAGDFGTFMIVEEADKDYRRILKTGGRVAQINALENPELYDEDTRKMYDWFVEEVQKRGQDELMTSVSGLSNGKE